MTAMAYASIDEFLAQPEVKSDDPVDDIYINDLLLRASRDGVDSYCQTWFYADTRTLTFDLPTSRRLYVDTPLLTVTTLTNGDGQLIPATEFFLWPYNDPSHRYLELYPISQYYWLPSLTKLDRSSVQVAGTWGEVDRAATDPTSLAVISATKSACLSIALSAYKERYGQGVEGVAQVTGAGVVITPRGIPAEAKQLLAPYRKML